MARTLDSGREAALVLQGCAGNAARVHFSLLIHEAKQEIGVLEVDVPDIVLGEPAVLLLVRALLRRDVDEYVLVISVICHDDCF